MLLRNNSKIRHLLSHRKNIIIKMLVWWYRTGWYLHTQLRLKKFYWMEFLSSLVIPILVQFSQINLNILSWLISQLLVTLCSPTPGALWLPDTHCSAQRPSTTQNHTSWSDTGPSSCTIKAPSTLLVIYILLVQGMREKMDQSKTSLELIAGTYNPEL